MSWAPNDLLTDEDLLAYERTILTQFGVYEWRERRQKALEDWLFPLLEAQGFPPQQLRTRHAPSAVIGVTSSVATDLTSEALDEEGLLLSAILAGSSDALYIGFTAPFRGLSIRMLDNVNAVASTLSLHVWTDAWGSPNNLVNTSGSATPFARGGALTWRLPENVVKREVESTGPYYWARLQLSVAPTAGTRIGALSVIRRSRLCAAVTLRTLALIFREAPTGQDGPWTEKADWYEREADQAWLRVQGQLGGEFDTDGDDLITPTEAGQTAEAVRGEGGWALERA